MELPQDFYSESIFATAKLIDYDKYKGVGRPRKTDYMSFRKAQRKINAMTNQLIDNFNNYR